MKTSLKLYGNFFKTTITQPSTLIIFFAGFILNAVFIVAVPIALNNNKDPEAINKTVWEIRTMSQLVSICTISLFCSVLGEIVANPNDRIFILSRPVKRSTYLTSKLLVSFTFAALFATMISICYVVLDQWCNNKGVKLYDGKMKGEYMIVVTFVLCIFGVAAGTAFRFYMREMIVSIIILVITMSYGIGFSFATNQQDPTDPLAIASLIYLETFTLPLAAILPLTIGIVGAGYFLINKVNIGA